MLGISPSVHRFSRTTGTSGHSPSWPWNLIREVNLLPAASNFGHTYDRKLLFKVYYTPRFAQHAEP